MRTLLEYTGRQQTHRSCGSCLKRAIIHRQRRVPPLKQLKDHHLLRVLPHLQLQLPFHQQAVYLKEFGLESALRRSWQSWRWQYLHASSGGSSNEGAPPQYRAAHELDSEPAEIYPRSRLELSPIERAELPPDGLSMKKAHGFPAKGQMSELVTDLAIDRKTMWVSPISTISPRSPSQQQTPRYLGNALS